MKHTSATIMADVKRFAHQINTDEVFGTHRHLHLPHCLERTDFSLVLTNRFTRTLPVAASLYITDVGVEWGKVMAIGMLIALPPLAFTFVAAKQILTGLTAGAVKG